MHRKQLLALLRDGLNRLSESHSEKVYLLIREEGVVSLDGGTLKSPLERVLQEVPIKHLLGVVGGGRLKIEDLGQVNEVEGVKVMISIH